MCVCVVCINVYMYVCLYGCMCYLIKHALPVFAIIALWQLLHLGTPRYGYMLLAFRIQRKLKLTIKEQAQIYIYIHTHTHTVILAI